MAHKRHQSHLVRSEVGGVCYASAERRRSHQPSLNKKAQAGMQPRRLRLFAVAFTALLALAVTIPWVRESSAYAPAADFAPTHSEQQAAERVRAAQHAQRLERPAASLTQMVYFPHTGHHLSNRLGFLDFWRANGQGLIFGAPLTEEIDEDGRIVQYFERARFEYHPELAGTPHQVQLGLIGREILGDRQPVAEPMPQHGVRFFPETGRSLWGEFLGYWERRGELPIFGYPISEETLEDGRIVQYFERARLEYHPENMESFYRRMERANAIDLDTLYEVRLSDLGSRLAQARGVDTTPVARLDGAPDWAPALWERRIDVNLSTQRLAAYEGDLQVFSAPVTTGKNGFRTPTGTYAIYNKLELRHMRGAAKGERWDVPNVPWVQYIVGGVALHGTYWHTRFGSGARISHGCINLSMDDAQWLYEWADIGTTVRVYY